MILPKIEPNKLTLYDKPSFRSEVVRQLGENPELRCVLLTAAKVVANAANKAENANVEAAHALGALIDFSWEQWQKAALGVGSSAN